MPECLQENDFVYPYGYQSYCYSDVHVSVTQDQNQEKPLTASYDADDIYILTHI